MSDNEQLFSRIFARVRVVFTSLGLKNVVKANLTGLGLGNLPGQTEKVFSTPLHGIPGVLCRPKAPDADGAAATGFAVRIGDQLFPLVLVDPRVSAAFGPMPDPGVALAGYNGEPVVIDSSGSGKITIRHGALSVTLDPAPTSVPVGVPAGPLVLLTNGVVTVALASDGFLHVNGAGIMVNGVPLDVP